MNYKNHMEISPCQLTINLDDYIILNLNSASSKKKTQVIIFSSLKHEICCKNYFHYVVCGFLTQQS